MCVIDFVGLLKLIFNEGRWGINVLLVVLLVSGVQWASILLCVVIFAGLHCTQ